MMHLRELEAMPPGENPFWHDAYHMGAKIADGILVMYAGDQEGKLNYIIVVNQNTGERARLAFNEKGKQESLPERVMNSLEGRS